MKKSILVAALSVLSASSVYAVDFGIGTDINDNSNTIYVPIKVSPEFRVEPYFSNYKSDQGDTYNNRQSELGVGLFKVSSLSDKTNLLLGVRASYVERNFYDEELEGYSVGPVLGVEYFPLENISIGANVSYTYTQLNAKEAPDDVTSSGTKTSIGVKFYFN